MECRFNARLALRSGVERSAIKVIGGYYMSGLARNGGTRDRSAVESGTRGSVRLDDSTWDRRGIDCAVWDRSSREGRAWDCGNGDGSSWHRMDRLRSAKGRGGRLSPFISIGNDDVGVESSGLRDGGSPIRVMGLRELLRIHGYLRFRFDYSRSMERER